MLAGLDCCCLLRCFQVALFPGVSDDEWGRHRLFFAKKFKPTTVNESFYDAHVTFDSLRKFVTEILLMISAGDNELSCMIEN